MRVAIRYSSGWLLADIRRSLAAGRSPLLASRERSARSRAPEGNMRPVRIGAHVGAGLLLLGSLAGCNGGGNGAGGNPAIAFSFASGDGTLAEGDGPTSVQVVLHAAAPLEADASVEVVDAGSGTA